MKNALRLTSIALIGVGFIAPLSAQISNGGFETGDFTGWTANTNWVIAADSRGWYSGWQGKYWAWSGGAGEAAMGKLRSNPFVLDNDKCIVRLMVTGWDSVRGTGQPRRWNYVTLNLASGEEIDRVWAPNTTTFVPVYLDGSYSRGQTVYIEAVDDADQDTFSMLGIDDVQMVSSLPVDHAFFPVPVFPEFNRRKSLKLEDDRYLVEVSRSRGSITRIRDKKGGLELICEPRLADSFRFTLPIPGKEPWQTIEANIIWGRDQKLRSYDAGAGKLTLHWGKPLVNYLGETFDASAAMDIELAQDGILFALRIDNSTRYQIGEVFFPLIGGLQGIGKTSAQMKATRFIRPASGDSVSSDDIFRLFRNMPQSWLGDQGPEQFFSCPTKDMPETWMEFLAPQLHRSVYIGAHNPTNRPVVLRLELVPSNSGTPRDDGNWPRPNELNGQPVGVSVCFVDFANAATNTIYEAVPVLISFHDGGWQEGKNIYKKRKDSR